jgi:lipopolysaccharide export system protein LptA
MRPLPYLAAALAIAFSAPARAADPQTTTIDSDTLESISSDTETTTTCHDNVVVTGNDITLNCDFLKVIATRIGEKTVTIGKYGKFKYMLATGNVKIIQGDRVATCGRAEVFPGEDRIVLTDHCDVKIESEHYEVTGPRMVLYRGQRRAVVEGNPHERPHITLPAIKDLGFPGEKAPQ